MSNTYTVSTAGENIEVTAESPEQAARHAVAQAYHDRPVPSAVVAEVATTENTESEIDATVMKTSVPQSR